MICCRNCIYYDDEDSYPDTGYCLEFEDYVKDDYSCPYFEENKM